MSSDVHVEAWLLPIPGDLRAGRDARHEAAHEAVRAEIAKLSSVSGGVVSWRQVIDQGTAILTRTSKDLLIGCYVATALFEESELRLSGLLQGLALVTGLLREFSDAFPLRARGRANALLWLAERLSERLDALPPQACDEVDSALRAFKLLETEARVCLGDEVPPLHLLERSLIRLQTSARMPAAAPSSTLDARTTTTHSTLAERATSSGADAPAHTSPVSVAADLHAASASPRRDTPSAPEDTAAHSTLSAPLAPASADDLADFLRGSGRSIIDAARLLFEQDRADARSYRLLRVGLWLSIHKLPAVGPDGRTRINFPDRRARASLERAVAGGAWESALVQSEGMARRNPFWLDAHWFTMRCLDELGPTYAAARAVVEGEARALLKRMPSLTELKFLDGSGFASPETSSWLLPRERSETDAATLDCVSAELRQAILQGSAEAFREAERNLSHCTPRVSFELRFILAQAFARAGKDEASLALLLSLERDVGRYRLDEWEPALALQVLQTLWRQLSLLQGAVVPPEAQRVRARLARLAPTALLSP